MDIEGLKEALGDEKFSALKTYVSDLIGQRDTARNESITGRKGKDQTIAQLKERVSALSERLGVDVDVDLAELPDARGQAEAAKQFEAKLRRTERERDDARKAAEEAAGKWRGSLTRAAVAEAMGGHEFVARDLVETYVSQRLTWEGEELLFKSDDGKLIPVKDGVSGLAKSRPELLKPAGTGGAGVRQANASGAGQTKTMSRAEFDALPPAQRMERSREGVTLT